MGNSVWGRGGKELKKSPEDIYISPNHHSHQHALCHRYVETGTSEEQCDVCKKELYGVVYACEVCKFLRHGSCAKDGMPWEITHPSHSMMHNLRQQDEASDFLCERCFFNSRGPRYHCDQCDIDFDLACVSSSNDQSTREDSGQIISASKPRKRRKHFSHGEPLALFKYRKTTKYYELDCSWCDKRLSGMSYGCFKSAYFGCCKFFLHESCIAKIPQRLNHPFHPRHHLLVQYDLIIQHFHCNACKRRIISPNLLTYYACHECHFYLHISCARLLPTLKHKCHKHSLTYLPRNTKKYYSILHEPKALNCNACQQDCDAKRNKEGGFYRCVQCDFNIHFKCLPAPSIAKNSYHRHFLILLPGVIEDDSGEYYCDICEEGRNPKHHIYYCKKCTFIAHVECVLKEVSGSEARKMMALVKRVQKSNGKSPNKKEIGGGHKIDRNQLLEMQEIHFLLKDLEQEEKEKKEDRLKYYEKDEDEEEEDKEEMSVKEEDEEDEELENEKEQSEEEEENEANQGEATTSMDGTEDLSPHRLTPSETPALNKIEHFSHQHPLNLFHLTGKHENGNCDACLQELNGMVYICKTCAFGLHKACTELPHVLQHPLHSQHSLSLNSRFPHSRNSAFLCDECRDLSSGFVYLCLDCQFKLDLKCAVFGGPKIRSQESEHREKETELFHFSHKHILVLGNLVHRSIECAGCNLPTLGPAYCCLDCRHIIHESCVRLLPKEMQHPFHPLHPLVAFQDSHYEECHACKLQFRMGFPTQFGFPTSAFISYGCKQCEFHLHFVCANSLRRVLKSSSHAHDLYYFGAESQLFLERAGNQRNFSQPFSRRVGQHKSNFLCSTCNEICKGPFYRCVECAINFHLKCCGVPEMIESKCHIHPLTLKDSFVEDDSGQYYCDVCEEERQPKDHVYYCEECEGHFVAHIECVLSLVEKIAAAEEESTDESSEVEETEEETTDESSEMEETDEEPTDESSKVEEIAAAEGPSSNRVLNSDNAPTQAESEESK